MKGLVELKSTKKSDVINQTIKNVFNIDREESIKENRCTFCNSVVTKDSFFDPLSLKEYTISGLCQKCQDKVFG